MDAKILVTGVNGFVGHHLVQELKSQGFSVFGAGREPSASPLIIGLLEQYFVCELTEKSDVQKLPLDEISGIISLAGLAAVGPSFDNPELYMKVNTLVLSVMCDEIISRRLKDRIRILAISSGAIYETNQPMPLTETSVINANSSPYAASKVAMEKLAESYRTNGIDCIVARPFNHIGPGQGPGFLLPDLSSKVYDSIKNERPLRVGNIMTKRDYTDVRDVVQAYVALISASSLEHLVYNVCSGVPQTGQDILELVCNIMDAEGVEIIQDPELFRPSDAPILYGDNARIIKQTSWRPKIKLNQTVCDFIEQTYPNEFNSLL